MPDIATASSSPKPFLPSDLPADRIFVRAVTAHCVAAARGPGERAEKIARAFWPRDAATLALIERTATAPATTTTSGWASQLAATAITSFIGSLQGSAAAKLIMAAPRFEMPGYVAVTLPRASSTGTPQFVVEGGAIPVAQAVIAGPQLGPPKKLALIESVTRELSEASVDDAEIIISTILRDAMARQLDLGIFSATAADTTRPAGILAGISATTATTGATGAFAALSDLRLLIDATVAAGGSGDVAFAASPGRAVALRTYAPDLADRVWGSAAITGGTLICVDVNSFCSMFGADPDIRASKETTLHYEDATPLQLTTGPAGSAIVATPSRSVFQQDIIAFRAVLRCAWALRVPGAVAFISTGLAW